MGAAFLGSAFESCGLADCLVRSRMNCRAVDNKRTTSIWLAFPVAMVRRVPRGGKNMDKTRVPIVATALVLAMALAANAQSTKAKFGATLKGTSETPPVDVKATGTATFTVSGTSV